MTRLQTPLAHAFANAEDSFGHARWREGYGTLAEVVRNASDPIDAARARIAVVHGQNLEDFKRGRQPGRDKHALLDIVDATPELPDDVAGAAHYERGLALHIEFIMATGDPELEERCFVHAAALLGRSGDLEGAALATAMHGVFHHVDRLDRERAKPILRAAYEMTANAPGFARSEAARHLGQRKQELGDLAGGLELLEESLRLREQLGHPIHLPSALHAVAFAQLELGRLDDAAVNLAAARRIADEISATFTLALLARTEADLRLAELVPGVAGRVHG